MADKAKFRENSWKNVGLCSGEFKIILLQFTIKQKSQNI